MTNQVENVTGTATEELSAEELYNLEWESESDSDQADAPTLQGNTPSDDDSSKFDSKGRAEDTGPATSRTADSESSRSPKGKSSSNPSGGQGDDDIWEGATEAQRLAFNKAQNDFNSMSGRTRAEQQRRADLEKELELERQKLAQINRKKGTYETEHPELFDEVLEVLQSRNPVQPTAQGDTQGNPKMDEDIRTVYKVHPDAQDLMTSQDWASFSEDLTVAQRQQFESDDPYEFIDLLNSFKTYVAVKAVTKGSRQYSDEDILDDAVTRAPGSSSRGPAKAAMSDEDAYDSEWAKDD